MPDFANLNGPQQAMLQFKLDGFIEACVHTARVNNIGLSEALDLTIRALLREIGAHKVDRDHANKIWVTALNEMFPVETLPNVARIN
ncbi:hypothetical protein ACSBOB_33275 [Mesorhizobium sp. ASY16-5R]|uniref:hypothetical protein n=1 Tax=Mesorhizobium sp. ASY16-5R TaxID=3445772 RepID=UPI003FA011BB